MKDPEDSEVDGSQADFTLLIWVTESKRVLGDESALLVHLFPMAAKAG